MKDLALLGVMAAVAGSLTWWVHRRRSDVEAEARRTQLVGAPSPHRSVLALARAETRRLHVHPATLIALFVLLPLAISLTVGSGDYTDLGTHESGQVLACVLVAWGVLIASACGVLRSRRHNTDELLATMPMAVASRTMAHLLASASLFLLGTGATAVVFLVALPNGFGTPRWSIVAMGPVLIVGAGVLGIAVARWIPSLPAAFAACVATIVIQANFHQHSPQWRWLHFLVYADVANQYRELEIRHDEWHLVFVVASIGLAGGVALLRAGSTRRVMGMLGVSALVLALSGFAQLHSPGPSGVMAVAARLERPVEVQSCTTQGVVTVCVWPRLERVRPALFDVVSGVVDATPLAARPQGITVAMRPFVDVRTVIDPAVARAVDPGVVFGRDPTVTAEYEDLIQSEDEVALAYRTALTIVGLPDTVWWAEPGSGSTAWTSRLLARNEDGRRLAIASPLTTCSAGGEARAVIAAWLTRQATLATRVAGSVVGERALADWVDLDDGYGSFTYRIPDPTPVHGTVLLAADWLAAAWLIENVATVDVQRVLAANWATLVDPGTPSSRVFELGGWPVPRDLVVPRSPSGIGAVIKPSIRCADLAP